MADMQGVINEAQKLLRTLDRGERWGDQDALDAGKEARRAIAFARSILEGGFPEEGDEDRAEEALEAAQDAARSWRKADRAGPPRGSRYSDD